MNLSVSALAVSGLLFNALAWGVSWWPFRELERLGLHVLWATALMYGLAALLVCLLRPQAWRGLRQQPQLWLLVLGSGLTNVCFNSAITLGDVVRVVLLFYLMPMWSIFLAWLILQERPSIHSIGRVLLALAGVALVLKTPDSAWPLPSHWVDWLAIAGGFCFALNNAMLRKLSHLPAEQRTFAMFFGGVFLSLLVGAMGSWQGSIPAPQIASVGAFALLLGFSVFFLLSNLALQYGAARLKASTTSLVMLTEILFATASSVILGAAQLQARVVLGGLLIIAAALWAAWEER
jgi:drug/metabolite transporter (DMT)-like permease